MSSFYSFYNNYLSFLTVIAFLFLTSCSKDDDISKEPITQIISFNNFTTTIPENPTSGQILGIVEASVPSGDVFFKMNVQDLEGALAINSETGELTVNDAELFNYENVEKITAQILVSAENAINIDLTASIILSDVDENNGFITTWRTTIPNDTILILPNNVNDYEYDYKVKWGDGNTTEGHTSYAQHSYEEAGTYTVEITGDFPAIYFLADVDHSKIRSIEQWGDIKWKSMYNAFWGCADLVYNAIDAPDLTQVTNMSGMFQYARSINGDLNNWDVSNIEDMSDLFGKAYDFNGNISNWDVSKVRDMSGMFHGAGSFNQDISNWDVNNVTDMSSMFDGANLFNIQLDSWNVKKVTNMNSMFSRASNFNQSLINWDVSSVKDMRRMFQYATAFDQNLGDWVLSGVEYNYTSSFLDNSGLSITNYTNTLEGWATSSKTPKDIRLGVYGLIYCDQGEIFREKLMDEKQWFFLYDLKGTSSECN